MSLASYIITGKYFSVIENLVLIFCSCPSLHQKEKHKHERGHLSRGKASCYTPLFSNRSEICNILILGLFHLKIHGVGGGGGEGNAHNFRPPYNDFCRQPS